MGQLTHLRYVGGGMSRPGLPARDLDHAEIAGLAQEHRDAAIGSGLYVPSYNDEEEPEGVAVPDSSGQPARMLTGPFIWTGAAANDPGNAPEPDPEAELRAASRADLVVLAKARGLAAGGTKDQLIERLLSAEAAAPETEDTKA